MLAIAISVVFMLVEFAGGYLAHSLAIMTDAAHLMSDVGSFCISLLTLTIASRRAGLTHSFGRAAAPDPAILRSPDPQILAPPADTTASSCWAPCCRWSPSGWRACSPAPRPQTSAPHILKIRISLHR